MKRSPKERYVDLPDELRNLAAFLLWKKRIRAGDSNKFDKIPYYVNGTLRRGTQGNKEDRASLCRFEEAITALESGKFDGLGLAMLPELQLVALDFDNCVTEDGSVERWVLELVEGTYAELSPSGRGVRAFYTGSLPDFKNLVEGIEVFHAKGFVTLTGEALKS